MFWPLSNVLIKRHPGIVWGRTQINPADMHEFIGRKSMEDLIKF